LAATLVSPIAARFPPSPEKTRKLLKPIVQSIEASGAEVREEFYRAIAAAATTASSLQFRSYFQGSILHNPFSAEFYHLLFSKIPSKSCR
jgi:hypothetical protein